MTAIDHYTELRKIMKARRKSFGMTLEEQATRMDRCAATPGQLERGYPRDPTRRLVKEWCESLFLQVTFTATVEFPDGREPLVIDLTPQVPQ